MDKEIYGSLSSAFLLNVLNFLLLEAIIKATVHLIVRSTLVIFCQGALKNKCLD